MLGGFFGSGKPFARIHAKVFCLQARGTNRVERHRQGHNRSFVVARRPRVQPRFRIEGSARRGERNRLAVLFNGRSRNTGVNGGVVHSLGSQETAEILAGKMKVTKEQAIAQIGQLNFLKVPATVQDTANAAMLAASDRARMITGTVANASAGAALD